MKKITHITRQLRALTRNILRFITTAVAYITSNMFIGRLRIADSGPQPWPLALCVPALCSPMSPVERGKLPLAGLGYSQLCKSRHSPPEVVATPPRYPFCARFPQRRSLLTKPPVFSLNPELLLPIWRFPSSTRGCTGTSSAIRWLRYVPTCSRGCPTLIQCGCNLQAHAPCSDTPPLRVFAGSSCSDSGRPSNLYGFRKLIAMKYW